MNLADGRRRRGYWYHGWNMVGIGVLAQVATLVLTFNCFSLFLHDWTAEFHVPASALALGIALFSIVCSVTVPFAGMAVDRFSARWIYGVGLVVLAGMYGAVGLATKSWQIVAIYSVVLPFIVLCTTTVHCQAIVSRWFVRRIGLAMGLGAFGAALGGVLFPPVIAALLPLLGWRHIWFLFGAVTLLVVLPVTLLVARPGPTQEEGVHYIGIRPAPAADAVALRWREIAGRRNFWVIIVAFLSAQFCFLNVSVNLAPVAASHGFGRESAGLLISLLSLCALCGKLCAGLMVDRWGNRLPLAATPLCCALGMGLLTLAGGGPAFVAGIALVGLAGAMWTLLPSATLAEFGQQGFGRAFGLINAAGPVSSLAAPLLARVNEVTGSYFAGLVSLGLFALFGAVVGLFFQNRPLEFVPAEPALAAGAA